MFQNVSKNGHINFNIEILYFDTTASLYLKLFLDTLFLPTAWGR